MVIEHIAIYLDDLEAGKAFFEKYFNGTAGKGITIPIRDSHPISSPLKMEQGWS